MNTFQYDLKHPIGLAVVTGSNGHLGANLVRVLLAQGIPVRAIVRPGRPHPALDGVPVEIIEHDVTDPNNWKKVTVGCTHLFHCAALFSFQTNLREQILYTAVEGTRNLLNAATKCSTLERIIYTSSTAAIGYSRSRNDIRNETDWNDSPDNSYAEAKTLAERVAWQIANERNLPLIVVNPSVILGFYDYRITPSMQMVLLPLIQKLPFTIPGGLSIIDATDCAMGHLKAADCGRIGERYILSSERLSVTDFYRIISDLVAKNPPRFVLGKQSGSALSGILESIASISGRPAILTRKRFKEIYERYGFYDSNKMRNELMLPAFSARTILARAVAWLLIGNAIPIKSLKQLRLQEEIISILPKDWKPGKIIQLQHFSVLK